MHYRRWQRHGDPLGGSTFRKRSITPPEARFWPKVDKSGDCWLWTGARFPDGYGSFRYNGVVTGAHRVAYELTYGTIPTDGAKVVDHRCRNRQCVRPDHLRLVTRRQNNENHSGPRSDNTSGVRNVSWYAPTNRWRVHVDRKCIGYFLTIEEAESAALKARNAAFTHNDIDRN